MLTKVDGNGLSGAIGYRLILAMPPQPTNLGSISNRGFGTDYDRNRSLTTVIDVATFLNCYHLFEVTVLQSVNGR
jgi:hypothetical protein